MKKAMSIIFIFIIASFLSSCGLEESKGLADENQDRFIISTTPNSSTQYPHMTLTKEQMLEDYDLMWEVLEKNYPFFGVLQRINAEPRPDYYTAIIKEYRKQIEEMELEGDEALLFFVSIIEQSLNNICGRVGHVTVIKPDEFGFYGIYRELLDEMPEVQPWVDVIDNPAVIAFYEYLDFLSVSHQINDEENTTTPEEIEAQWEEEINRMIETNLRTEILEDGKTAYIYVRSFGNVFIEGDLPKIRAFLEEIKDYEHLIIDIQDNGGGNTDYWEMAFVRPNIAEPVNSPIVRLMSNSKLAVAFYGSFYEDSAITIKDVRNNPAFTALYEEDLKNLALAREMPYAFEPEYDEKLFSGQIWVLVSPQVYSASEAFAVVCKTTQFATLIGKTTGGSNSGGGILYALPNSNLLVSFDVEYILNPNGSCNMETGTAPDIESEDALQTVLDIIAEQASQ